MNKKYLLAVAASTLMLAACGDEVTEIHQDGMAVLEVGEKLSKQACDTANVGEMLFVADSSEVFFCDGESWQTLKGADGKDGKDGAKGDKGDKGSKGESGDDGNDGKDGTSCTAKSVKNKAGLEGVEVTCGGAVVDTIWNGKDGQNGNDGDDGTSCTAKSVKNKAGLEGVEVTCGGAVVDTIWNGAKGESGNDGVGCSLKDDGDGKVTVTCGDGDDATTATLYKAVCGTKPYDPLKSFCSEGELYSCDDRPYDPLKSFCLEGELYSCGDKPYDPEKQYCLEVTRNETKIYSVEDLLTDSRDEQNIQVYKTVKICNDETSTCQTWMAENLNYSVNPNVQSWCGGGSDATEGDCSVYGRLYTWAAAVGKSEDECGYEKTCNLPSGDIRGVCPEGWHLPSNDEWNALFTAVGGTDYAGQKLKADSDLCNGGTSNDDSFGFAVLPVGFRYDGYDDDGRFVYEGHSAYFWSSTEGSSGRAYRWYFYCNDDHVYGSTDFKNNGFSVRCLRD